MTSLSGENTGLSSSGKLTSAGLRRSKEQPHVHQPVPVVLVLPQYRGLRVHEQSHKSTRALTRASAARPRPLTADEEQRETFLWNPLPANPGDRRLP